MNIILNCILKSVCLSTEALITVLYVTIYNVSCLKHKLSVSSKYALQKSYDRLYLSNPAYGPYPDIPKAYSICHNLFIKFHNTSTFESETPNKNPTQFWLFGYYSIPSQLEPLRNPIKERGGAHSNKSSNFHVSSSEKNNKFSTLQQFISFVIISIICIILICIRGDINI